MFERTSNLIFLCVIWDSFCPVAVPLWYNLIIRIVSELYIVLLKEQSWSDENFIARQDNYPANDIETYQKMTKWVSQNRFPDSLAAKFSFFIFVRGIVLFYVVIIPDCRINFNH